MTTSNLPILIVAYCRAARLEELLRNLQGERRRIYVAIDKAPKNLRDQNNEVIAIAEEFRGRLDLRLQINDQQAGVKFGVPYAVDWIFQFEESCIILEDDCEVPKTALTYFDEMSIYLGGNIALISGDSPWSSGEIWQSTLCDFPLIWGWATNRVQWTKLRELVGGPIPWTTIFCTVLRKPKSILPISYFLAAQIRVKRNNLQAWDCSVALGMLLQNLKCIIPNVRIVENFGSDEFAHHTVSTSDINRSQPSNVNLVSSKLNTQSNALNLTNKAVRKRVYKMKRIHLLSPLKALLKWD